MVSSIFEDLENFNIHYILKNSVLSFFLLCQFSDTGLLFTCGDGSFGQLGLGDYWSQSTPVKVDYFANNFVNQIACGMRHSLVLLKGNCSGKPLPSLLVTML